MQVKSIEITNVKGIANKIFELDLIPNKPNILVAPNGFGKSSFGVAFDSLKSNKIELDDKNYYEGDVRNHPELKVIVEDSGNQKTMVANSKINEISDDFDVFVINNQVVAKGTLLKIGGKPIAKSIMEIPTTALVPTIPAKVTFDYSLPVIKKAFGANGKILPDISSVFKNGYLLYRIENEVDLKKFNQARIVKRIELIKSEIKQREGTAAQIIHWIENEKIDSFREIEELYKLAAILNSCDIPTVTDETSSFLAALQIVSVFHLKGPDFKKACKFLYYLDEKQEYGEIIKAFNSTRFDIKPKEDKKKGLLVEWPKAHEISNGQRDVLSFIVLMLKARRSFQKKNCILIIDEIFDYLDDANLISFQYFITEFIETMKGQGRNFFPILLTHLDPMFFNHFCFNRHKIKVHYLKKVSVTANPYLEKLIRRRNESSIQNSVDQHYFHFHPSGIDITREFNALGLNPTWGESKKFHQYILKEVNKYINDKHDYDPLAICFGVRCQIEYLLYQQITDSSNQQKFIDEHGTKNKLEFYETLGLNVPEIYYLLGIIYNDGLHWHNRSDFVRPIAIKLENLTIKKLISDIF